MKCVKDYAECLDNASEDFDDYYTDFHNAMLKSEQRRHQHHKRSAQLGHRPALVNFLREISEKLKLARLSLHLAIYIKDIFIDNFQVADERLQMFAAVCLIIASKIEDRLDRVPHWEEIQGLLDFPYPGHDYIILECMILNSLNWKVGILPTGATFLEYYIRYAITPDDHRVMVEQAHGDGNPENHPNIYKDLKSIIFNLSYFLLDLSLDDLNLTTHELPSKVAAAIVLCARFLVFGYESAWTEQLQTLTKYQVQDIQQIANVLRKLYKNSSKENQPSISSGLLKIESQPVEKDTLVPKREETETHAQITEETTPPMKIFKYQL